MERPEITRLKLPPLCRKRGFQPSPHADTGKRPHSYYAPACPTGHESRLQPDAPSHSSPPASPRLRLRLVVTQRAPVLPRGPQIIPVHPRDHLNPDLFRTHRL